MPDEDDDMYLALVAQGQARAYGMTEPELDAWLEQQGDDR